MPRGRKPNLNPVIIDTSKLATLPETKEKNGYHYTLVTRSAKAAIYKMVNVKEPEDKSVHYEVFKVCIAPAVTLISKTSGKAYVYPPTERFPGNNDFGIYAWTYNTKEYAMQKYNELNK